jgi:hypothetical protein
VVAQNEVLCRQKSAHHGPTSDGHEIGKQLWEEATQQEISLFETIDVCRKCHRVAPFTNFNGNTFSAIARIIIRKLNLPPEQDFLIRSLQATSLRVLPAMRKSMRSKNSATRSSWRDEEALRAGEVRHSCRTLWRKQLLI